MGAANLLCGSQMNARKGRSEPKNMTADHASPGVGAGVWSRGDTFALIGVVVTTLTLIAAILTVPGVIKESPNHEQRTAQAVKGTTQDDASHGRNIASDSKDSLAISGESKRPVEIGSELEETSRQLEALKANVKRVIESCRETAKAFKSCGQSGALQDDAEGSLQGLNSAPQEVQRKIESGNFQGARKQINATNLKINALQMQCDPSVVCNH